MHLHIEGDSARQLQQQADSLSREAQEWRSVAWNLEERARRLQEEAARLDIRNLMIIIY